MQIEVTSGDIRRTVSVQVGDTVRLLLSDPGKVWEQVSVSPGGLLAPEPAPSPPALGQLEIWTAVKQGTVEISASGRPDCRNPVCPMYALYFQVTLVIS
jgi:hypothetical protein